MEFKKKHYNAISNLIKKSEIPENIDNQSFLDAKEGLDILHEMTRMKDCEIAAMEQKLIRTVLEGCWINHEGKLFKWYPKGFRYVAQLTIEYSESIKLAPEYCSCAYPKKSSETFGDTLMGKCEKCQKILLIHDS